MSRTTVSDARKKRPQGKGPLPPKIPAFKFSKRNKSADAYRDRLRVLVEKYGVKFSFRKNAKLTGQRKGAITRQTRKLVEFLNPDNNFQYVPTTKRQNKGVRKNKEISRQQVTPGGVFLPRAKVKSGRKTKFRISDSGVILSKTGNFTSHFRLYPSTQIVSDPAQIARDAKELGAETVFVSIKGHRGGSRKNGYSLKAFMRYMAENIIPDIEEAQEDEEKKTAFRNWFGVEFVTFDWNSSGRKKKRKTKKRSK